MTRPATTPAPGSVFKHGPLAEHKGGGVKRLKSEGNFLQISMKPRLWRN
jgi:hypothetical protein